MSTYSSCCNKKYTINENKTFGKGGEGTTYEVIGRSDLVAKIYHESKRTDAQEYKLKAMLATNIDNDIKRQFAWPIDILYQNGKFAGFIMKKVIGVPLNVIYDKYKNMKLSKRITIAKNLCVAVNNLNYAGQVVGDLNPNNMLVVPDYGTVTLIDCDSFHITNSIGHTFRCEVGMPQYISRDLSLKMKGGNDLKTVPLPTFSEKTDSWALATHIFQLLMMGAHPFAIAVDYTDRGEASVTCPQPIDNIRKGIFPFYDCPVGFKLPAYAPEFKSLSAKLKSLFVDEFSNNKYVSPKEWYDALCDFEKRLKKCKSGHEYNNELHKCPYCEAENKFSIALTPAYLNDHVTSKSNTKNNISNNIKSKTLNRTTFIVLSVFMSLIIQVLLAKFGAAFYYDNKLLEGMFDTAAEIVQKVGPYFNLVIGFAASCVYMYFVKNVKWWHYLLTVIVAGVGFLLAPLIVYILGYIIPILLIVGIIALICCVLG